ncbi:MAG: hypothetical protein U1E45_12900 [Geminicoccaceae bacterium]
MTTPFVIAAEAAAETLDWGRITSLIRPANTGAKDLAIVHAHFFVGQGHAFHRHTYPAAMLATRRSRS